MIGQNNGSEARKRFSRRRRNMHEPPLRIVSAQEDAPSEASYRLPPPYVTYALLLFMGLVFVAMVIVSHGQIGGFSLAVSDLFGDKENQRILYLKHLQQWWRFVTPIFLHGSILHIAVNAYSLYILGRQMEPFYGRRRYLLVFMVAGIAGNVASFLYSARPSLGASGAIFGLVGAGIVFPIRFRSLFPDRERKLILRQLIQVAAINLLIGFMLSDYVDNACHVGGLLGGGFAALFILPDGLDPNPIRPFLDRVLRATTAAIVLLIGASATLQACWAIGPWWRLNVPAAWKPVGKISRFEGHWRTDDETTLDLTDTDHQPDLLNQARQLFLSKDFPNPLIYIGGEGGVGRHIVLQNGTTTVDLYLILIYDRMLILKMETPTEHYAAVMAPFQKIVASLHILHQPPPDLHPIGPKSQSLP